MLYENTYGNKKSLTEARDFSVKLTPHNVHLCCLGLDPV